MSAKRMRTKRRKLATEIALENEIASEQNGHVDLQQCKIRNTPACLRKLYHMDETYAKSHNKSLLGVVGFNDVSIVRTCAEIFTDAR